MTALEMKQPDFQPFLEALMGACFLLMLVCFAAFLLDFLF